MAVLLSELLAGLPVDVEHTVNRTRNRLSKAVRDGLRNQTGLLLNRMEATDTKSTAGQKSVAIPVSLEPGITGSLRHLSIDADPIIIQISPFRSALERAKSGLKNTKKLMLLLQLKKNIDDLGEIDLESPEKARLLIGRLLALLDKQDPLKKILAVDKDILGVYRYNTGRDERSPSFLEPTWDPFNGKVELYWAVIGWFASMLGVTTEALTAVVLIHELAHGYTHMGADIDNERWTSWKFADSDHALKEGLAQYYTALLSRQLDNHLPGIYNAYKEFLKHQPPAYHTHLPWIEEFKQEEVRLALISIRKRGKATLDNFENELHRARKNLRRANVPNSNTDS